MRGMWLSFPKNTQMGVKLSFSSPVCGRGGWWWCHPFCVTAAHLWCGSSWLRSLPRLIRMNPALSVRYQERVKESPDQKEQVY